MQRSDDISALMHPPEVSFKILQFRLDNNLGPQNPYPASSRATAYIIIDVESGRQFNGGFFLNKLIK
jgi:hypothetical protein